MRRSSIRSAARSAPHHSPTYAPISSTTLDGMQVGLDEDVGVRRGGLHEGVHRRSVVRPNSRIVRESRIEVATVTPARYAVYGLSTARFVPVERHRHIPAVLAFADGDLLCVPARSCCCSARRARRTSRLLPGMVLRLSLVVRRCVDGARARGGRAPERIGLGSRGARPRTCDTRLCKPVRSPRSSSWHPAESPVAIGTGFTGRMAMGQGPFAVGRCAGAPRTPCGAWLRGQAVEVEGAMVQMLHADDLRVAPTDRDAADRRRRERAEGPRGRRGARRRCDDDRRRPSGVRCGVRRSALGTVLDDDEDPRVRRGCGEVCWPGADRRVPRHVRGRPGGGRRAAGRRGVASPHRARFPDRSRHLAVHEDHLVAVTERIRPLLDGDLLRAVDLDGVRLLWKCANGWHCSRRAASREILYAPMGPDVPRELRSLRRGRGAGVSTIDELFVFGGSRRSTPGGCPPASSRSPVTTRSSCSRRTARQTDRHRFSVSIRRRSRSSRPPCGS